MLQGPQPSSRTRKKQINTRTRAQTDYQKPPAYNNQNNQNNQNNNNKQQAQDDLLDLFGSFAATNNHSQNNNNNNPFGDPFSDFGFGNNNNNNNNNNTNTNQHSNESKMNNESIETPKKKKKKKKKKTARVRAQTVSTNNVNNVNNVNKANGTNIKVNGGTQKSAVKMKKIDVLPLLHKGIRANKFKLNGNKSKVRTFYLTESNFYFCWEAVSGQSDKKSLFGGKNKNKGQSNRTKIDKDRSIPIRAIRSLQKNPAYMMQSYNFIPAQQKSLTLSIVYSANGQDKKLNFMSYEPFHNQLFYEGLQQLITAARDPKRNLNEVFELYVDFPKEILPKHLRPQRFKWEPLGDNDLITQNNNNNNNSQNNNNNNNNNNSQNQNNMYFDNSPQHLHNINVFDPTVAQYGRNRVKSF